MDQNERRRYLLKAFLKENRNYNSIKIPSDASEQRTLLRGLMNIRMPHPINQEILNVQDEYLQESAQEKGIVDIDDLTPIYDGIYLWKGDITRLRCGAVVNAANSQNHSFF